MVYRILVYAFISSVALEFSQETSPLGLSSNSRASPLNSLYSSQLMVSSLTLFLGFCSISQSLILNIDSKTIIICISHIVIIYFIINMYALYFDEVTFAQSAKYMIIAKNNLQTKRSQVCSLWTSVPTFLDPILLDSLDNLIIKACSATIDKKLTVIGSFEVSEADLRQNQVVIYEESRNFNQLIEQKQVCVGNCKIKIKRNTPSQSPGDQLNQIDDEYELKSEPSEESENEEQRPKCELKFIIHGGFDFYLNAGFKICINWGSRKAETKLVSNRIAPFWGKTINIEGKQDKYVQMCVIDNKGSKLEWLKLDPKQIRLMYPYHLHIRFREEYVGMHPHFFVTIIREDVPLFSILDKKINMKVKYVGPAAPQRTQQYLLIYPKDLQSNEVNRLPLFVELDMRNYISFDTINKLIEKSADRKYDWTNWNLLIPINIAPDDSCKEIVSLLKSFLSKSLVCIYFTLDDPKSLFCQQTWNSVNVIDRKEHFDNAVKELYYKQKRIIMGKSVELSNSDIEGLQNEKGAVSMEQKWKILSHNYELRMQMLAKSIDTTESTKKQIKQKGEYLQHLKKVLIQVKKVNEIMVQKQKTSLMENGKVNKKIRQNYKQYSIMQIVTTLLEKQVELEKRKKINDEMRMRMDSLHYFNEDSEQLDKIIVENAQKLLEQQNKIKQLNKIREILPKQREVIRKMEKMFEKRQIDRSMNELLHKQQDKLNQMKKAASRNLEKVYTIVKDHKNTPNSLLGSIKAAQAELIRLNAQYAKLTAL